MVLRSLLVLVWASLVTVTAFTPLPIPSSLSSSGKAGAKCHFHSSALWMGKGLNKAKNKQADLAKKLEQARLQREESVPEDQKTRLSDAELKARNDRLRFEEMLKTTTVGGDYEPDGYLSMTQEEQEIQAARSGLKLLFEGDPAPSEPFEELVHIVTENAIGKAGASRILPWLRKNMDRRQDYLVVVSDPRPKSTELRSTIQSLSAELSSDILDRFVVITADSPAENRRWMKKGVLSPKLNVYSDEKMEWMRAYGALGANRWSMTMYVVADERIQKLAREMDAYQATRIVTNAVKSLTL